MQNISQCVFMGFHSEVTFGARQTFFKNHKVLYKISLQLFLFDHSSKIHFFRAIWSLVKIFEISIFLKILKNFEIFEKSIEKAIFHWKKSNFGEFQRNVFRWVLGLQIWLRHQKASIVFENFILKNYITARALPRALWTLEYSTYCARDIFPIFVKIYRVHNMWNILVFTARA